MKIIRNRVTGLLSILLVIVALVTGPMHNSANAQPGVNINFQTFYDELSPYGQWLNDPQYGYVWAPNAGNDFRPYYTNGYWTMTDYGNMWVSNYDWGWAPFHYGRWTYSDFYGWIWVPGTEWGPAWVSWRQGGGYYGWAPMGPGISINISFGPRYSVPNPWWTFIPYGNIYSRSFHRYYSPRRTVNIINNTTIVNNTYIDNRSRNTYVTGPRRNDVERTTGRRVTVYGVANENRAGATKVSGRNVNIYRPAVTENGPRSGKPAPRQVKAIERPISGNTVRPAATKETGNRNERVSNSRVAPQNVENRAIDNRSPAPVKQDRVQPAPGNTENRNVPSQQRVERTQPAPQRVERVQPQPRVVPQQPRQRVERTQPAPQRVERVQPQPRVERAQPQQRVERAQPAPQRVERAPRTAAPSRGR